MPSEDFFQRLTAGATFNRTLSIFTKRFKFFLLVSLIIYLPFIAFMITIIGYVGSSLQTFTDTMDICNRYLQQTYNSNYGSTDDIYNSNEASSTSGFGESSAQDFLNQLIANAGVIAVQLFLEMLVFLIFEIAGKAAIIYGVGQIYVDRDPSLLECFKQGFTKWCALFCAGIMVPFGLLLGNLVIGLFSGLLIKISSFFILIVIAVYVAWLVLLVFVSVSLIILCPTIVIENLGPIEGIKRAWSLAQNDRCYIFCTLFCFILICQVVTQVIVGIMVNMAGKTAAFSAWGVLVASLPALIYLPLCDILETVVYMNICVQREAMNRGVLMNNLDGMLSGAAMVVVVDGMEDYKDEPNKDTYKLNSVSEADII